MSGFYDNGDGTYRYTYINNEPQEKKNEKKKSKFFSKVIIAAIIFGLISGAIAFGTFRMGAALFGSGEQNIGNVVSGGTVSGTAVSTATAVNDVSDIAGNVMPAIVQVTNMSVTEYRGFFGQIFSQPSESAGSGVIVADDSSYIYIATNNHVVKNSREITITFCNDEAVSAEVRGTYPDKDLAVIRVNKSDIGNDTVNAIKIATIADSNTLSVGQASVVIGNALGYGQSVTTGVVSALNREVTLRDETSGEKITNTLIQTDAAINPGNSGGALLNMNGEVIGIISAKYSDTDVEGMGYAIPITDAKVIIDAIIANGSYTEEPSKDAKTPKGNGAYLGIYGGMDIDQSKAARYDLPTGVYVSQVVSGSGAEKAGIESGDVIRGVDGKKIASMESLQSTLASYKPGDIVTITIADSREDYIDKDVDVVLGERSE